MSFSLQSKIKNPRRTCGLCIWYPRNAAKERGEKPDRFESCSVTGLQVVWSSRACEAIEFKR